MMRHLHFIIIEANVLFETSNIDEMSASLDYQKARDIFEGRGRRCDNGFLTWLPLAACARRI